MGIFTETDAKELYDIVMSRVQEATGPLYPGDERRIFTEALISLAVTTFNTIDDCAKQSLLKYARGEVLDAIADGADCVRLSATKATTTIKYTFNNMATDITIPAGTRVASANGKYFETFIDTEVMHGVADITIPAVACEPGASYNGYLENSITTMVDPVSYAVGVTNTAVTAGGTDEETDDALRERIRLAWTHFSTCGTPESYKYWAMQADSGIGDVSVTFADEIGNPHRGDVTIRVAMADGTETQKSVLEKVMAEVSNDKVRPVGDIIAVGAAVLVNYDINVSYTVSADTETEAVNAIESKTYTDANGVERTGAIEQYRLWQDTKIGRGINPSKLISLMINPAGDGTVPGATSVTITTPVEKAINESSVAHLNTITVSHTIGDD